LEELVDAFDVSGISKSPAIFDYKKLNWLNGTYLRAMSEKEFHSAARPYIRAGVQRPIDTAYAAHILKERCELLSEIPEQLDFVDKLSDYSLELFEHKKMGTGLESSRDVLSGLDGLFKAVNDWSPESLKERLADFTAESGLKNGQVLWPLRVALSGKRFTPGGGVEICALLGKEESLFRIEKAVERLSNR
jgi:glutamyl-tRNA synthetase